MDDINSIGVFCSASNKVNQKYFDLTKKFGMEIAKRNYSLVYGGASVGLMGSLADACLEHKGKVVGVIPEVILKRELAHENLTELIVTKDMHERKKVIYNRSDIIAVLPGGLGTLDEACEFMTWNQLGIHNKKIAFISENDFFDDFERFCLKLEKESFIKTYDDFKPHFFKSINDFFQWI